MSGSGGNSAIAPAPCTLCDTTEFLPEPIHDAPLRLARNNTSSLKRSNRKYVTGACSVH
jgi:hypothetical protein